MLHDNRPVAVLVAYCNSWKLYLVGEDDLYIHAGVVLQVYYHTKTDLYDEGRHGCQDHSHPKNPDKSPDTITITLFVII